jgi:hypothetical protein
MQNRGHFQCQILWIASHAYSLSELPTSPRYKELGTPIDRSLKYYDLASVPTENDLGHLGQNGLILEYASLHFIQIIK